PSQSCLIRRRQSVRIHTARDMGGAENPDPVKKAATILHDYSDRNPSYRQTCTTLTARNFTALTSRACELVQIN
ncbi:MAG: hypothetical protein ACRC23_21090, partial [Aeromonas jandaei]